MANLERLFSMHEIKDVDKSGLGIDREYMVIHVIYFRELLYRFCLLTVYTQRSYLQISPQLKKQINASRCNPVLFDHPMSWESNATLGLPDLPTRSHMPAPRLQKRACRGLYATTRRIRYVCYANL
jgi:hypothetical protein